MSSTVCTHIYEIRPRSDHRGVDLISDVLPRALRSVAVTSHVMKIFGRGLGFWNSERTLRSR
jgi:hypothetical protein